MRNQEICYVVILILLQKTVIFIVQIDNNHV